MNISTIQKTRFLNNIYKILYCSGTKVNEALVKSAFSEYFSANRAGFPIDVNYNLLRSVDKTNVDLLNQIMVNTIFNVDILYEGILENNEKLFSVVTSLNKKLESLKTKRVELESKIDDMLFVNNNTDGYFSAYTENFANANKLDLNLTDSIFYDPALKNATISKLDSDQFNVVSMNNLSSISPVFETKINGQVVPQSIDLTNFSNIFDGLSDTYWSHTIFLSEPRSVSLSMNIPIGVFSLVSKIDGIILTSSPLSVTAVTTSTNPDVAAQVNFKDAKSDYDSFSFSVPSDSYSSIEIILQKNEPDFIDQNTTAPYAYKFGLRDLAIGSRYHAANGVLISAPISIPSNQNSLLTIDAVAIDVVEQVGKGTSISYFVAPDNPNAESISDFSWLPISPSNSGSTGFNSIVYLDGSVRYNKYIKNNPDKDDLAYLPLSSISQNINEINPTKDIYFEKEVYRIAALDSSVYYLNPILLGDINSFKHCYKITQPTDIELDQEYVAGDVFAVESSYYKDLSFWNSTISDEPANLFKSVLKEQLGSIIPGINSPASGYISSFISRDSAVGVSHTVIKSSIDFDLAIYLNGVMIGDLPRGILNKSIQFNFISGINKILITYDKNYSGIISFSLMEGLSISRYGTIFANSFRYLDPLEFQGRASSDGYYFTLDTVFGRKEILATKSISGNSNFIYTVNNPLNVPAVRYRVDMNRYSNPYSSPALQSIRLKFKHKDA